MSPGLPFALCLAAGLAGCFTIGNSKVPIGTVTVPALRPGAERTLVIVLPGFGDDAQDMRNHGLAEVIRESWPETDVLLTSATFAYYRDGRLVQRLHDEIVGPSVRGRLRPSLARGCVHGRHGRLVVRARAPRRAHRARVVCAFPRREQTAGRDPRRRRPANLGPGSAAGGDERRQLSAAGVEDGERLGATARARSTGVARLRHERSPDRGRTANGAGAARVPLPGAAGRT